MDTGEVAFHVGAEGEIEISLIEVPNGLSRGPVCAGDEAIDATERIEA